MTWILIALVCFVVLIIWRVARSFLRGVAEVRKFTREVDDEVAAIERLTLDEAAKRIGPVIRERAMTQEWTAPPSRELAAKLDELDKTVGDLLRRYRRIRFPFTETDFGAEFLLVTDDVPIGMLLIGMNQAGDDMVCVKPRSPTVYDVKTWSIPGCVRKYCALHPDCGGRGVTVAPLLWYHFRGDAEGHRQQDPINTRKHPPRLRPQL